MSLSSVLASLTGREQAVATSDAAAASQQLANDFAELLECPKLRLEPATTTDALGPLCDVRERISEILPGVKFHDNGVGVFMRTVYSVSFDTGCADEVCTVRVQVTGGVAALPSLQRLVTKTGWRLVPDGANAVAS